MTRLFTCSYAAWKPAFGQPVVTSLTRPKWIADAKDWPACFLVSPRWRYRNAEPDVFRTEYLAQLDRYSPQRIAKELEAIARQQEADTLCLMCFEADPEKCHRGLFASWLLERTGELAAELIPELTEAGRAVCNHRDPGPDRRGATAMNDRPTPEPAGAGPWRLLILLTSGDDPLWAIATITNVPGEIRPAEMQPGNRRYKNWHTVIEWAAHQAGHPVSAVPVSAMVWRLDEQRRPR